jgi:PhnB protein
VNRGDQPTSIMPELSVRRGRAAIEFYKDAFGAVEAYRVGGAEEHEPVVAQLAVGGASFWVAEEAPPHGTFSPESLGGGTVRLLLVVDDPDAVVERAVAAGAEVVSPVGEEHRWRLGRIEDPFRPPLGNRQAAHRLAAGGRRVTESQRSASLTQ